MHMKQHKKSAEEEGNDGSQGNNSNNRKMGRRGKELNEDTPEDHMTSLCNFDIEIEKYMRAPFQTIMRDDETLLNNFKKAYQQVVDEICRGTGPPINIPDDRIAESNNSKKKTRPKNSKWHHRHYHHLCN